nr:hypothetical protein [Lactobacillus sp. S2-2]
MIIEAFNKLKIRIRTIIKSISPLPILLSKNPSLDISKPMMQVINTSK